MMPSHTLDEILTLIEGDYRLSGLQDVRGFVSLRPILSAEPDSLTFVSTEQKDKIGLLRQTRSRLVICDTGVAAPPDILASKCLIQVDNPKLQFLRIGNKLFGNRPEPGIHPTAVIDPGAQIQQTAYIGPFTYVGKCVIGEGTLVHGHVHLYDNTIIGANVTIHAGCVIGADGFGYLRNDKGELENFPHLGGVLIEDNVEIGSNTCVDRGALGNTIVRQGAKIDNLVHIAHNVVVGRHALIIADTMIGGSTVVEDYAWVSPSSVLRDQIRIGKSAVVGLGSVVTKDVPDSETWVGSPARPLAQFLRMQDKLKALMQED